MDGTLTIAVHDFEGIRRTLGLPPGREILEALAAMPPAQSRPLYRRLDEIEQELAGRATAAAGAPEFLSALKQQGKTVGILTRNSHPNALRTLRAAGLDAFFDPADLVGRDEAHPKPDPDGIRTLLRRWGAPPEQAVMVGDYLFDLQAGRAAGTATVYVDPGGRFPYSQHADLCVRRLAGLLARLPAARLSAPAPDPGSARRRRSTPPAAAGSSARRGR